MPDLYHVVNGIELFSPKFNVVPGVNENYYFPYSRTEDRLQSDRTGGRNASLWKTPPRYLALDDPNKRPVFSMARLDRIKTSLVYECFGKARHCRRIAT